MIDKQGNTLPVFICSWCFKISPIGHTSSNSLQVFVLRYRGSCFRSLLIELDQQEHLILHGREEVVFSDKVKHMRLA